MLGIDTMKDFCTLVFGQREFSHKSWSLPMRAPVHTTARSGIVHSASRRTPAVAALFAGLALAAIPAMAQRGGTGEPLPFLPVGTPLTANNAQTSDQFGEAVAISGDTAVVGSWLEDNDHGLNAGSAYVYRWDGQRWIQTVKIYAPDGVADDRFGQAVAVYHDLIVVGASLADVNGISNAGAAYVYRRVGAAWSYQGKIVANDPYANDRFGLSVAISDAGIAIGAPREERQGGLDQGAVYTFSYNGIGWFQTQKLIASKPGNNDWFGFHLAMDGTTLAVGAQNDDTTAGLDAGSVSIFRFANSQWQPVQYIKASDGTTGANFGSNLSLYGDFMVVGAERDTVPGVGRAGSAYVFTRDTNGQWNQSAKLVSSAPAVDDFFGSAVGISGKTVVVGAEKADVGAVDSGSVQTFEFQEGNHTWVPGEIITSGLNQGSEFFGSDLAFSNGLLLVSAPFVDLPDVADAGAAFAFAQDHDCNGDGLGDVSQIALGQLADVNGNGIPDMCECLADWDHSGGVNSVDVGAFVNDWFIDQANGTLNADVNANGVTNTTDVSDFINAYFDGCI
jgi:hypothetical protein